MKYITVSKIKDQNKRLSQKQGHIIVRIKNYITARSSYVSAQFFSEQALDKDVSKHEQPKRR